MHAGKFGGWLLLVLLVLALLLGALLAYGAWRWQGLSASLQARLESGRQASAPARYRLSELDGLPAPVQRYFRAALQDGMLRVAAVDLLQRGSFNLSETGAQWKPFSASQRVLTQRPGFVWDARIAVLPGLAVHVHDAYAAGEGLLRPSLLGAIDLTLLSGGGAVAEGELMRYLAEAPWYPTALLPGRGVVWTAVDERHARATLTEGPTSVSLLFEFGDDALVSAVRAEARSRSVAGQMLPTPWEGRWFDYRPRDGMLVPMRGEVAWLLPEGRKPYWRGSISAMSYEFTRPGP